MCLGQLSLYSDIIHSAQRNITHPIYFFSGFGFPGNSSLGIKKSYFQKKRWNLVKRNQTYITVEMYPELCLQHFPNTHTHACTHRHAPTSVLFLPFCFCFFDNANIISFIILRYLHDKLWHCSCFQHLGRTISKSKTHSVKLISKK